MASKYWIKLYHEILDDPKMGRMPDRLWRRTIELFLLAGELDEDGLLPEVRDMAWRLRLDDDSLTDDLSLLETYKIVHRENTRYVVTKFADRQSAMTSAERTRRYRETEKHNEYETVHYGNGNEQCDGTVTNRYTDIDIDKDIDIDTEEDIDSDLFQKCRQAYETKKGLPVTDGASFALMISNFAKNNVTVQDYIDAIDAMDADKRYKGSKPTSYERWALGIADKRQHPHEYAKDKKTREQAKHMRSETYVQSWAKR